MIDLDELVQRLDVETTGVFLEPGKRYWRYDGVILKRVIIDGGTIRERLPSGCWNDRD